MNKNSGGYAKIKNIVSPGILALILFFYLLLPSQEIHADNLYLNHLIRLANQKELFKKKYWKVLLHYQNNIFGPKSLIDDPDFFLARDGKNNPRGELEATLKAFFQNPGEDNPAICRFIARYVWLKEQLGFDDSKIPLNQCDKFNQIIDKVKPRSATLIYPAEYMNNPASMFGHTLINIGTESKNKLLSHAVNYSAFTGDTFGPLYAIRGIFGFYKGYFSMLPYYEKVQEYCDISQRDIWEYQLNLTNEEVIKMVMHLWELQNIYSNYYFFNENCSYNLMFLLDAARPSLGLSASHPLSVIPIDTVKQIKKKGIITKVNYRSSKVSKIRYMISRLNENHQNYAFRIAHEQCDPKDIVEKSIALEKKAIILDLAIEFIQYRYVKKELSKDRYANLFLKTLQTRSTLQVSSENLYHIPEPPHPETGHRSNRLELGFGLRHNDFFQELGYRPVYHCLLDNDQGYDPGAQIQLFNIILRYYYEKNRFVLNSFDLVDIKSLSPRDIFFKPHSWKVQTGLKQKYLDDRKDHLIYQLNTGGGFSYYHRFFGLYYSMLEFDLNLGDELESFHAIGIGPSLGLKKKFHTIWTICAEVNSKYYFLGDNHLTITTSFDQNFSLNRNNSIILKCSWNKSFNHDFGELVIFWNFFF